VAEQVAAGAREDPVLSTIVDVDRTSSSGEGSGGCGIVCVDGSSSGTGSLDEVMAFGGNGNGNGGGGGDPGRDSGSNSMDVGAVAGIAVGTVVVVAVACAFAAWMCGAFDGCFGGREVHPGAGSRPGGKRSPDSNSEPVSVVNVATASKSAEGRPGSGAGFSTRSSTTGPSTVSQQV